MVYHAFVHIYKKCKKMYFVDKKMHFNLIEEKLNIIIIELNKCNINTDSVYWRRVSYGF